MGKKLLLAIRQTCVDGFRESDFSLHRTEGVLFYKGAPLARVEPEDDESPSVLRWHFATLSKNSRIIKDKVAERYAENLKFRRYDQLEWSI